MIILVVEPFDGKEVIECDVAGDLGPSFLEPLSSCASKQCLCFPECAHGLIVHLRVYESVEVKTIPFVACNCQILEGRISFYKQLVANSVEVFILRVLGGSLVEIRVLFKESQYKSI